MALTGPKLQMPSTLSDIFVIDQEKNIISMKPEWATFFNTVQKTIFSNTRSGPTSLRPTSTMSGRYLGMPFYDTTLQSVIFLTSTNPDHWQIGAAATWGAINGVLSNQTDLQTALNAKQATSSLATVALTGAYGSLSGLPLLGSVASTAASTWAFASSVPGPITFASSAAQTTVSLGLNTFSTATTISLAAGTWMLNAQILVGQNPVTTQTHFTAQLTDGTNNLAQGQQSVVATVASSYASIPLGCVVTYGAASTVSLQAAGDITGGFIRGWPWQNSQGSTATMIQALKLA